MDDNTLISKILSGHTEGYRLLYARHKQAAWSTAMYICKNETIAKDAVQQSFVSAYKYLESFRKDSSFKTWILRIVKNECYRLLKRENRFEWEELEEVSETEVVSIDVLEQISIRETQQTIQEVLGKMKDKEAIVLQLFYLQELSLKEVGEVLGCTTNNVKVLLYRARLSFKMLIENSTLAIR